MFCSNPRNREFSKYLSKLVHQNLGEEIERAARQRANGSTDQREVPIKFEDIGKGLDKLQSKDKHCWQEPGTVLDTGGQSETLAANLLERLQDFATTLFEERLYHEQRIWTCNRGQALPG